MTKRIFFFHNPKAGGTSIRRAIEQHYPGMRQSTLIENDIDDHKMLTGRYSAFEGYEYYAGHYGRDVFDAINDRHACITNFRHPVTRLASLYNYFRHAVKLEAPQLAQDRFYAVAVAQSVSFNDFLAEDDTRVTVYTCNQHFRQLTSSPWSLSEGGDLDSAFDFVDRMRWYYICEYPELSMLWMHEALGIRAIAWHNVTGLGTRDLLDEQTFNLVRCRNALDICLYKYAVDRLLNHVDANAVHRHPGIP